MKAIVTFIFIVFVITTAMAQNRTQAVKVATTAQGVELNVTVEKATNNTTEVARLYMFKNSRVKKALAFKTKRNKAKMA